MTSKTGDKTALVEKNRGSSGDAQGPERRAGKSPLKVGKGETLPEVLKLKARATGFSAVPPYEVQTIPAEGVGKDGVIWMDGAPCPHPGCLSHVTHPCEGCGRIGGRYPADVPMMLSDRLDQLKAGQERRSGGIRATQRSNRMAGLLQQFQVSSDTGEQLQAAISIVLPWNRSGAKGFRVGETDKGFAWIEFAHKTDGDFSPLPYPLDTLPKLFTFVRDWLSSAKRGQKFDTDGSVTEGWIVTQPDMHNCWEPSFLRVQTTWIIYGK